MIVQWGKIRGVFYSPVSCTYETFDAADSMTHAIFQREKRRERNDGDLEREMTIFFEGILVKEGKRYFFESDDIPEERGGANETSAKHASDCRRSTLDFDNRSTG